MPDATDQIRKDWDRQADAWYDQRESLLQDSRPIHDWLVTHLQPREGQRVLEVAAGPGDTGFMVAPRLGSGRLVSTDLSPQMVEAARKRGAELGMSNVEYRVLDAQGMDLPDASFDSVVCRWGFMLMPDPGKAMRECRRVLVPGGRLVFAVFRGPEENPFAALPARVLVEAGHLQPPGATWKPGILALADRDRLETLLKNAGFTSVGLEIVEMSWNFPDAEAYWRFVVDLTAMGPLIASLPESAQRSIHATIDQRLGPFTGARGVSLPSRCWCGVAS